jgi:hypothetical protein
MLVGPHCHKHEKYDELDMKGNLRNKICYISFYKWFLKGLMEAICGI